MNLKKFNRHWDPGFKYPYPKKRTVFHDLVKSLDTRFIVQIVGLRRTGKTVLMFQLINHLIDRSVNPLKILYFTFDEEKAEIDEIIKEFEKVGGFDTQEKVYIFLDEIQKLPDFEGQIKIYYDLYPNIKFFISGSTSLFIRKKTRESLAGRVKSFFIGPLSFKEYLFFIDRAYLLDNFRLYFSDIEKEFEKYLFSQFIEAIELTNLDDKKEYYRSIIEMIVYKDIPTLFPIEYPELLYRIVKIVGAKPGILVDYKALSNDLGVSNKTLSLYFSYLVDSFLMRKIYNFSPNLLTSEKKLKKFYLSSPSLSWAVSDNFNISLLVENVVLSVSDYKYFWQDPYKHEVDFVSVNDGVFTPIEVKYKSKINLRDIKGLRAFSRRFKINNGILLAKVSESEILKTNDLKIAVEPVYLWV